MYSGYLSLAISLLIQLVASLVLFNFSVPPITLFALSSVVILVVFGCFSIKRFSLLLAIIKLNFVKVLTLNALVATMLLPLYFCLSNGLEPAIYAINFSAMLALLSTLEKRNIWFLAFLFVILVVTRHYQWDLWVMLSLLGPVGAYGVVKIGAEIGRKYGLNTSNVMVLRYILSGVLFLVISPWLPPITTSAWSFDFLLSLFVVVFFYNIFAIFFSQRAALQLGHEATAMGFVFLPFFTFVSQHFILHIDHNYLTIMAVLLIVFYFCALKLPYYWSK